MINIGVHHHRRILRVRRRDCVPSVELRRRLCLTSMPALLVQRRFRWFGHEARRPEGQDAPTNKANLEPFSGQQVFGHARWRKDWVKVSSELTQDR